MNTYSKKGIFGAVAVGTLATLALAGPALTAQAQSVSAALTSQMQFGAQGAQVSNLQTLLSTDTTVYPEQLVTGYYGSLTQSAVQRFQCREGIVCSGTVASTGYGRVGPSTLMRLNSYITAGGTIAVGGGNAAPLVSSLSVTVASGGTAVVTWVTNEAARGKVYYQNSFPTMVEGSATAAPIISGTVAQEASFGSAHSVTITGLTPGQTYYYVVESTDASGSTTLVWPRTFTAQ